MIAAIDAPPAIATRWLAFGAPRGKCLKFEEGSIRWEEKI
jgi:hypothetical protein